ncbi:hypothetical protein [Neglectibacter caecimuris]|uniref:hypothetical protein n=1 Tax=Neglectibacter caecimuris TaxID=3093658 RepID=UPI002AC9071A|nr:hypothetical protein [Neglectibacter sp. M00184]
MKKHKRLARLFALLGLLFSHVMCAAVAYSYCALQWGGQYAAYSAPASVAFLLCIPYGAGIALCSFLAWFFRKRCEKD